MVSMDYDKLAVHVCDAIRMGRKPNPGIKAAERDFGKGIVKLVLGKSVIRPEELLPRQQRIIRKLMGLKYGPLIYKDSGGKLRPKPLVGETLGLSFVNVSEPCRRIAMAIRNECWKRGCHVSVKSGNDADSRLYFETVPEDTITELPPLSVCNASNVDASMSIGDKQDREWSKGFEKKLLIGAPSGQKLYEILDRKQTRWCLLGYPVKMDRKKDYLVSRKRYEQVYKQSIVATYHKRTKDLCWYYRNSLQSGNKVRITAKDGTDLTFSIKGRPILIADGIIDKEDMAAGDVGLNIPDGETFLAPLEYSANGRIFFDYCNIPGQGFAKGGLWITFRDGKAVKYEGTDESVARFKRFLDSNTGEKDRIAELGIGTNRAAKFIGTIIVDEKIYGTVHIAIGNNTGAYHGKNKASSHFDMIKQMKGKKGNLYVDGRLVMKDGEPAGKV